MKLSVKILLIFIIVIVILAGGGGYLIYYNFSRSLEKEVGQRQLLTSRQIMEQIDIFLYERLQNIKTIGQSTLLTQAFKSNDLNNLARANFKLKEFFYSTGPWNNLVVINTTGKIVLSSYEVDNLTDRPNMYKAWQTAMQDQVYYSDAVISLVTNKPTIFYASPIKDYDQVGNPIVGVVVGELAWPALTDYLQEISAPSLAHLLNKNYQVIGTNEFGAQAQSDILKVAYANHPAVQPIVSGKELTHEVLGLHNNIKAFISDVIEPGYLAYQGNHWSLLLETPSAIAFAAARESSLKVGLLVSVVALIFLVFLFLILQRFFVSPILTISSAMLKRTKGDRSLRLKIETQDEIGQMSAAFNQMADTLNDYYYNLEEKVRLRTEELSQKNQTLEETQKAMTNIMEDLNIEKDTLAKEKSRDEAILAGIGDAVFVIDIEERITLFNPVAEKISGYTMQEALGKKYNEVLNFIFEETKKVNDKFVKEAMVKGKITQMANHTLLIKKDGSSVPVADSAAPIKNKQGQIFGCVVVFRDITRERAIDQMKSEFVSVASHQLRTPLTGIKWFTEFLLKAKLSAKTKDYVKQIYISNERMVRLVDDLLNVSHIETGRKFDIVLKDTDIVPIVKSVLEEQASEAKKKQIGLSCAADAPHQLILPIDELKIRQVFQNLVSNAIKYSREKTNIVLGCQQKQDEIAFYVKDQGIGIPQHQQGQIFNKFFRAENVFTMHTDGTGLGLYIVKAIVEAHKGKIWFESVENQGTTFYFTLPKKSLTK